IGTTAPVALLELQYTGSSTDIFRIANPSNASYLDIDRASGEMRLNNGNYFVGYTGEATGKVFQIPSAANQPTYFNNGGNVGIGTSNPLATLDVGGLMLINNINRPALEMTKANTGQNWSVG